MHYPSLSSRHCLYVVTYFSLLDNAPLLFETLFNECVVKEERRNKTRNENERNSSSKEHVFGETEIPLSAAMPPTLNLLRRIFLPWEFFPRCMLKGQSLSIL